MPLYEYHCDVCNDNKEIFCNLKDRNNQKCPNCGAQLSRVFNPTPTKFIGDGWSIPAIQRNWPKKNKIDRFDMGSGKYVKDSRK